MFGLIGPDGAGKTTTLRDRCSGCSPPDARHGARPAGSTRPRQRRALSRTDRLPLAALLALRRPHAWTRTSPSSREIHGVRDWRAAARRAPRDAAHDALPRPPGRSALRRDEAEARPRLHAHPHARASGARRAHDRRRSGLAPGLLAASSRGCSARASRSCSRRPTWTRPSAARAWRSWTAARILDARHARRAARRGAGRRWSRSWPSRRRGARRAPARGAGRRGRRGLRRAPARDPARGSTRGGAERGRAASRRGLRAAGLDVRSARPTTPSLEDVFIGRIRARGGGRRRRGEPMRPRLPLVPARCRAAAPAAAGAGRAGAPAAPSA